MAVIKKFKVLKVAYFLGIFGIFSGFILGVAAGILTLYIPILFDYEIWQMILVFTFGNGILMFILSLIFVPLVNLSLKIIKGIHLETSTSSLPVKGLVSTKTVKKPTIKPITKPSSKKTTSPAIKPITKPATKSTIGLTPPASPAVKPLAKSKKPEPIHPIRSARDSKPLSQMTNVKTTGKLKSQKPV
jgi:hypothetical protein